MTRLRRTDDEEAGFTLVELLVVIIIIGVLAAIAVPAYLSQRQKGYAATATSDLRNAATAEEAQMAESGDYVADLATLESQGFKHSADLKFGVETSSDGYCEVVDHDGTYWWYDSSGGGLVQGTTTTLTPPAAATGSCAEAAPSSVE